MKPNRRDFTEHGEFDSDAFEEATADYGDHKYEQMKDERMEKSIEDERVKNEKTTKRD